MLPPTGFESVTVKPSSGSSSVSPVTTRAISCSTSPAAKLTVPEGSVPPKSAASASPETPKSTEAAPVVSPDRLTVKVKSVVPVSPSGFSASVAAIVKIEPSAGASVPVMRMSSKAIASKGKSAVRVSVSVAPVPVIAVWKVSSAPVSTVALSRKVFEAAAPVSASSLVTVLSPETESTRPPPEAAPLSISRVVKPPGSTASRSKAVCAAPPSIVTVNLTSVPVEKPPKEESEIPPMAIDSIRSS